MKELDARTYQQLVQAGERVPFEPLMDPMLIPRVAGTQNHAKVKQVCRMIIFQNGVHIGGKWNKKDFDQHMINF